MPHNTQESAMMICYRECLTNLEKFDGRDEQQIKQFINNIERIGRMIDANDGILHCMCLAKLDGEAKRWYDNNISLTEWQHLKSAILERFTTSDSSAKIFEQLKERKQRSDETITSYYDGIIKLCHEYDPSMSQKMILSWLENGIKDSLKIQVKRQLKTLPESARNTQAFLKIAKDEQELQEEVAHNTETTTSYTPYFANTVSTTLQQAKTSTNAQKQSPRKFETFYPRENSNNRQSLSTERRSSSQQRSAPFEERPPTPRRNVMETRFEPNSYSSVPNTRILQPKPCLICRRNNHRTIDCHFKKEYGCYKCGQSDHRIRHCPQVFH